MYQQIQRSYNIYLTNGEGYSDPTAAAALIAETRDENSRRRTAKILHEMEVKGNPVYRRTWSRKTA